MTYDLKLSGLDSKYQRAVRADASYHFSLRVFPLERMRLSLTLFTQPYSKPFAIDISVPDPAIYELRITMDLVIF